MIKLIIGAMLVATTAVAQTPKTSSAQSTTGSAKKASAAAPQAAKATQVTKATSGSATRPAKPIPNPPLKEKLESGDNAIPSYKQEKDAGVHRLRNRYKPRRTATGARKDTMKKQSL